MAYRDDDEDKKGGSAISEEVLGEVLDEDADEEVGAVAEAPVEEEKAWE